MHHLTKFVFGLQLTPPGIGDGLVVGEAGMELEEKLFSGVVSVVWGKGEVTEMEKVQCLVLNYRGGLRDLCE